MIASAAVHRIAQPDDYPPRPRQAACGEALLPSSEPADPATASALYATADRKRELQTEAASVAPSVWHESVTRPYGYLLGETEDAVRPAAVHQVQAMGLSDQWVREGCLPDGPLLPVERATLVRAYSALLAAVHRAELR